MTEIDGFPPPNEPAALSKNALTVLKSRYLIRDERGKCIETPAELFSRAAWAAARAELAYGAGERDVKTWHRRYYDLMAWLKFLPNSPVLMNAGRPNNMLSACFVLPIEDSIEGIFETVKQTALIQKAGGGTGFSLDKLRPAGDRVLSSGGTTSGPMSFWQVFSQTTDAIQQGAFRRGANMGMMSVTHPDILKFLHAKQNLQAFTNFNISVKITDDWMKKLAESPDTAHIVINPRTGEQFLLPRKINIQNYKINALHRTETSSERPKGRFYTVRDIWKMIVSCAHKTGEPGVAFIDKINRHNPTPALGLIEATNPCGEQPLLPYEACTLGSINLTKFVKTDGNARMDWQQLGKAVALAVRFLDNIIDVCDYPVRETVRLAKANRKIGLGVMGFADCLFMLGIAYDSKKGVEFGGRVMAFINEKAHRASNSLADSRGPFPNWSESIWRKQRNLKMHNAAVTCIAPTGTISIIADCTAGIEPAYSLVFTRRVLNGRKMRQTNPIFRKIAEKQGFYDKELENHIAEAGSIQDIKKIPPKIRRIFKCAYDIRPDWHVKMQAAFQRHCDAAVSKTINFRENATITAVDKAFKLAYQLDCKGITIYRRDSRRREPMALD